MESYGRFSGVVEGSILGMDAEECGFWTLKWEVFHFEGRVAETRLEVNDL